MSIRRFLELARNSTFLFIATVAIGCGGRAKTKAPTGLDAMLRMSIEPHRGTVAIGEPVFFEVHLSSSDEEARWLPSPALGSASFHVELISPRGDTLSWEGNPVESDDTIYLPAFGEWYGAINLLDGFGELGRGGLPGFHRLPTGQGYRVRASLDCSFDDLQPPVEGRLVSPPVTFDIDLPAGISDRTIRLFEGTQVAVAAGDTASADAGLASLIYNYPLAPITEAAYDLRFRLLSTVREQDAVGLAFDFLRLYPDSGYADALLPELISMIEDAEVTTYLGDLRERYADRRGARYASKHFASY
ncbi:MAG: hypothetical protein CME06_01335 [Gemmatimonadetes bacterium]|nr:hypothetical protein [Gemmatimonadota bacterium]